MKKKLHFIGLIATFLFTTVLSAQTVFINEIHYDNDGADTGEAVEIAGPAGTDLTGWSVVLYNGNNNSTYGTTALDGIIPDQQNGFGTYVINFPGNGIQNGSPDGLALVNAGGEVIQFLSYEGTITAIDGPAAGMTSTDIGVSQSGSDPVGQSLQLGGDGQTYQSFTWQTTLEGTFGAINTNQSFGGETTNPEPEPEPELPPAPAVDVVFINEIHYDNDGTDAGEGFEIAGTAGTDLSVYSVILYNGNGGTDYKNIALEGVMPDQQNGYGTLFFSASGLQNGAPDGLALVKGTEVIQFLSYEGELTATAGMANGMTSTDIGVEEGSSTPAGYSLQLTGEGSYYDDFTWATEASNTYNAVNNSQIFLSPEPVLFFNEFHYDTAGTDSGEGIEVAGTAGLDLSEYSVLFYNGSNGEVYKTQILSGTLPNLQSGYGTMEFYVAGIQNGSPDGFALVKGEEVLQFLSYEGTFIATNGAANGMTSTEVGVSENGAVTGTSLQLGGTGFTYEDFTWQESLENTFAAINSNQFFGGTVTEPEPEIPAEPGTIAYARAAEVGSKLVVEGTLTVSYQHGNTAYLQDETGGIAIFGNLLTEEGLYQIGDSLRVTGTRAVYNELIQISDVESVEYLGVANESIEPVTITLAQLEDYRGQLVKISDVSFPDPGQLFFGNANFLISDASGEGELRIDSDVTSLVGKTQPDVCAEVIGVVGRYNNINQLLPRQFSDLPCAEEFDPTYPGSDISKDLTFDAVTWNIEWFGDEKNAPSAGKPDSDAIQKEAVKAALLKLDADVVAVNEISDDVLFAEMVSEMEGYAHILSDATSYPDEPGGQKVGFIYKTTTVQVTNTEALLTELHPFYNGGDYTLLPDYPETADRFFASGRMPFLMEAKVTIDGETSEMKFIALHARANSGTGSQSRYDMRKYDVEILKNFLDTNYPDDNVIIMGDYNDDVDVTVANVSSTISTYDSYITDSENYFIPTASLSEGGYRSYVVGNYNDMIDHIMLTNELQANYIAGSARVHYELYNGDYTYTTSDHFPVSVRLVLEELKVTSIETTGVLCSETDTATATVYAEGGIAPYTYVWSTGQTGQTATGLTAGTYTVTVSDYLDNSVNAEIVIKDVQPLVLTVMEDQTVFVGYTTDCTTLSATSVSGGSGEYTYLWSTGETSETISVCPSEDTTYLLEVTDVNRCSISAEVNVEVIDISCGKGKNEKVQVCYKGKTLCIATPAVESLLKNGAQLGSCNNNYNVVSIEEIVASPNPTSGYTVVRVTSALGSNAILSVYGMGGNKVQEEKVLLSEGTSNFQVNLGRAIPGIYIVKIKGINFESEPVKIIKY